MRARSLTAFLVSSLLFACSSASDSPGVSTPGTSDPVPSATPPSCPVGTHVEGLRCSATMTGFKRSTVSLAPVRDHHTTHVFVVGGAPYLYVFGGTEGWKVQYDDVWRAKIRDDGELEAFESACKLPELTAGHTLVKVGDTLVLAGGTNGARITAKTYAAKLGPDGMVGTFVEGPSLPMGVMHGVAAASGDYVYFVGGRGAKTGKSVADVSRVRVSANGTLGEMESLADLPADRSHGQALVYAGRLYVFGGLRGDPAGANTALDDVLSAEILADGRLGEWKPSGTLPAPRSISSAELVGDDVFLAGGLEGQSSIKADVWRGTFDAQKNLVFELTDVRLPFARGHVHQTPFFRGKLYSVGGKNAADRSFGTVDIASFE
jgi:hypothetical protein